MNNIGPNIIQSGLIVVWWTMGITDFGKGRTVYIVNTERSFNYWMKDSTAVTQPKTHPSQCCLALIIECCQPVETLCMPKWVLEYFVVYLRQKIKLLNNVSCIMNHQLYQSYIKQPEKNAEESCQKLWSFIRTMHQATNRQLPWPPVMAVGLNFSPILPIH